MASGTRSADEMKKEFDATFARPREREEEPEVELLAIRAGDLRLALRVAETQGIARCPSITPLPSRAPSLLGLSGLSGNLVAMYSLSSLLAGRGGGSERPWVALCGEGRSVGLVFDEIEGSLRVSPRALRSASRPRPEDLHEVSIQDRGIVRSIVSIPAVMETLKQWTRHHDDRKE